MKKSATFYFHTFYLIAGIHCTGRNGSVCSSTTVLQHGDVARRIWNDVQREESAHQNCVFVLLSIIRPIRWMLCGIVPVELFTSYLGVR